MTILLYYLLHALTFCLSCDYETALPCVSLSLVIDLCLFIDLKFVAIKPHMDPNSADSFLGKERM